MTAKKTAAAKKTTTAKKTTAKKTTAKKAAAPAVEKASEIAEQGQAAGLEATQEHPPPGTDLEVVAETSSELVPAVVSDPVTNTLKILADIEAAEILTTAGVSNLEILTATDLATPRNAVRYLTSHVQSHPDIDDVVDRDTERAALMGYQAWTASDRDDKTLEAFLRRRWGLPAHSGTVVKASTAPAVQQAGVSGWIPDVPAELGNGDPARTVTYDEAFEQARREGFFRDE